MEQLFFYAFSSSPPPHERVSEEGSRFADTPGYRLSSASTNLFRSVGATRGASNDSVECGTTSKPSVDGGFKASVDDNDATTMEATWTTAVESGEVTPATSQHYLDVGLPEVLDSTVGTGGEADTFYDVVTSGTDEALIPSQNEDQVSLKLAPDEAALAAADWLDGTCAMLDAADPEHGIG